ncbi:hypothetical protein AVEN_243381-1 [Araneus ventricosus]|uniref:Uncharacterized protein n=1 Tax=Araneus ventricosus TaxID=182803 RepID=A0A4Y2UZE7_ARAVE|nr:hypothetical protein AVEN_243381-1 [Araneus ventricosus]
MGEVNAAFREGDQQEIENGSHKNNLPEKETNLGYPVYVLDVVNKFKEDPEIPEKSLKEENITDKPNWKKALYFLCGVSSTPPGDTESQEEFTAEQEANLAAESITEKPLWRRICNASAVLLLAVCCFMWGYYA